LKRLEKELEKAKRRFGLPAEAPVASCYEAGRDGFWLHRQLVAQGIENRVVDSSSIEVNRRARQAKTDRLDAEKLVLMLWREVSGAPTTRRVWSVVRVPSVAQEDGRQDDRERRKLKRDRQALRNEIESLLATQGIYEVAAEDVAGCQDLPPRLRQRLERSRARLQLVQAQLRALEQERRERVRTGRSAADQKVRLLEDLRGIGDGIAFPVIEEFGWREFRNARQVGAAGGLTGSPWSSGTIQREQGISKAGNARIRTILVEAAWLWLRHQPHSALSRWYRRRFARGGKRLRRLGIVALARKLLIALWRYWSAGVVPDGAVFKTTTC
jgi:transposase